MEDKIVLQSTFGVEPSHLGCDIGGAKKLGVISFPTKLVSFLEQPECPEITRVVIVLVFLEALILILEEKRTQRLQITLPKTNVALEDGWLEDEIAYSEILFSRDMLVAQRV